MLSAADHATGGGSSLSAQFQHAARALEQWRNPLLLSHVKPDGDALGCLVALRGLLRNRSIQATALVFDPLPSRYSIFDPASFALLGTDLAPNDLDRFDSVIILDTCTYSQLEPVASWLRTARVPKLAIDHHRTRDHLADVYIVDESAAAACLILHDFARAMQWPIDHRAAEALFVGIATDTGWFRHSNTDDRVFAAAAELERCGADCHRLYERFYLRESPARIRLLVAALGSMELLAQDRLSVLMLDKAAFDRAGATRADTEDIINEPLRIGTVVVSVLLVEQEDGVIRASLRSRSPSAAGSTKGEENVPDIDVAAIAQRFGGGGHSRAAGLKHAGPLSAARTSLINAVIPLFP